MITDVAFVLCAGLGERLRPMTLALPKPLAPLWNRPLLGHTLGRLSAWGVREVYVNAHWLGEQVAAFAAGWRGAPRVRVLEEPERLGTGGALRGLGPHLGGRPFWLVNGDIVFDVGPQAIEAAFAASGNFGAAWLEPVRGPRTVEMDYAGRITCWRSPTPGVAHTFTFTGVSLLGAEVVDFLPGKKICSVVEAFERAAYAGKFVRGVSPNGAYWNDVGTPEAYLEAHRDARRLPTLHAYAAGAEDTQPAEVARALEALGWAAGDTIVAPLGKRGSGRTFWRLVNGDRRALAIAHDAESRPENARYGACARALAGHGVAVPRVLADLPGLLALEDLGDETLDRRVKAIREAIDFPPPPPHTHGDGCACGHGHAPELAQTMELLAAFHRVPWEGMALEQPFDAALYEWEADLYERFVAPFPEAARAELRRVREALLAEPPVLVHRDFQSSNLLWRDKRPWVIDFQGMRRGAAVYDLASFFFDPYVDWGEAATEDGLAAYARAAGRPIAELRRALPLAGIQRLTQAIGAYHRLASVGHRRFLAYVPTARARAAALADTAGLPALARVFGEADATTDAPSATENQGDA